MSNDDVLAAQIKSSIITKIKTQEYLPGELLLPSSLSHQILQANDFGISYNHKAICAQNCNYRYLKKNEEEHR